MLSPQGELTPIGTAAGDAPLPRGGHLRVRLLRDRRQLGVHLALERRAEGALAADVVNQIELNVDDLNRAPEIAKEVEKLAGARYTTTTWMERNRQLLSALKMERLVTIITIGLIELVAALNIFITLVMMVMEKYRDIAVLMSMGARQEQIRRIFMLQGVLIGVVGSAIGLVVGLRALLLRRQVPLDPARRSGVLAELRAVRAAAGWTASGSRRRRSW